jgi:hypothetical protein
MKLIKIIKKEQRVERVIDGVNLIQVYYMHVRKYHNETPFVQLTYIIKKKEKLKIESPYDLVISSLYINEISMLKRLLYTLVHALLFTILNKQQQPTCPESDEWVMDMWYIQTSSSTIYPYKR